MMKYKKIHILDDDKISSMLLEKKIESIGYTGTICKFYTAVEAYKEIGEENEILFLDQNLESCTGEDVVNKLSELGLIHVKIVLISSHFTEEHEELRKSSVNIIGKITKPFMAEQLKEILCL